MNDNGCDFLRINQLYFKRAYHIRYCPKCYICSPTLQIHRHTTFLLTLREAWSQYTIIYTIYTSFTLFTYHVIYIMARDSWCLCKLGLCKCENAPNCVIIVEDYFEII